MTKIGFGSSLLVTAAFAFAAATAPAQAKTANEANGTATASGASAPTTAQAPEKRYCVVDEITGSRLPVKVCKTKKEWEAEGVQIPAGR